jgi:hypothetical protein
MVMSIIYIWDRMCNTRYVKPPSCNKRAKSSFQVLGIVFVVLLSNSEPGTAFKGCTMHNGALNSYHINRARLIG